jgi:hypothetical protein
VLNTQLDGRVNNHPIENGLLNPTNLLGPIANPSIPVNRSTSKANREFLPNLTIEELDNMPRVRVHANQANHLDVNGSSLPCHPYRGNRDGLANLLLPTRDRVEIMVSAPDHQNASLVIHDKHANRHNKASGNRCRRIQVVVDTSHGDCLPLALIKR